MECASVVDFFSTAAGAHADAVGAAAADAVGAAAADAVVEFHSLDFEGELAAAGDADAVDRGAASMVVARNTDCGDVSHDGADALDDVGGGGSSRCCSKVLVEERINEQKS